MEKALKAFYNNQPLIDWPYVVGVENGDATLYIGGKLSGVTDNNKKYMPVSLTNQLKVETKPYNETWCEVVTPTNKGVNSMKAVNYITEFDIRHLLTSGHCVAVYSRKHEIVVDGWKRYKATKDVCITAKQLIIKEATK